MRQSDPRRQQYERWVRSHAAELYGFAYRLCGRADSAEDLVQDTFYEAWRNIASLHDPSRARAWLFQILRHRYAHLRRDESRRVRPTSSAEAMEESPARRPGDPADELERQDLLQTALNRLEDDLRLPFLMVFQQGLTCREAAEQLQLPLGTVLSRIHHARQALRQKFGSWHGPESDVEGAGPPLQ